MTQSQNTSSKAAILMESAVLNNLKFHYKLNWHQISDFIFQVNHAGFVFLPNHFIFEIVDNVIQQLIPTGVMQRFVNDCTESRKSNNENLRVIVLRLTDLKIIFFTLIGFYVICVVVFVCEIISVMIKI